MFKLVLCVSVILSVAVNGLLTEYPSNYPRCNYGDGECIKNATDYMMNISAKGIPELNIVPIDPLFVDTLKISQGKSSSMNMVMTLKNVDIYGLSNANTQRVIGFEKDIETSKYEIYSHVDQLILKSDYMMKGKMLLVPMLNRGKCNLTIDDVELTYLFDGNSIEKEGEQYLEIQNMNFSFIPQNVKGYFGNLFNGDKELGDAMNKHLNDNWRSIFDEMKPAIFKTLGDVQSVVMNNFFSQIPYRKLFLDGGK